MSFSFSTHVANQISIYPTSQFTSTNPLSQSLSSPNFISSLLNNSYLLWCWPYSIPAPLSQLLCLLLIRKLLFHTHLPYELIIPLSMQSFLDQVLGNIYPRMRIWVIHHSLLHQGNLNVFNLTSNYEQKEPGKLCISWVFSGELCELACSYEGETVPLADLLVFINQYIIKRALLAPFIFYPLI